MARWSCSRASVGNGDADLALVELGERRDQALHVVGRELDVELHSALLLQCLQLAFEHVPVDPVDHLAVHLDEPPVRVVREARVAGRRGKPFDGDVVEPQVEDRVHHPRHRDRGARAHRDEQRVRGVAEAFAGLLLQERDVLVDLGPQALGHLACLHGGATRVGRDREAGGNGDAQRGHLGKPDALAAEELPPSRSLLVVCVDQPHGADPTYGARLRRALEDPAVQRVAVIATASGCGKTTFARALAEIMKVPFVELDAIHHQAGWTELDAQELRRRVEPLVERDAWVIDGSYRGKLGYLVLERADTVVWLDLPAVSGSHASSSGPCVASRRARSSGTATASRCGRPYWATTRSFAIRSSNERPRRHRYPRDLARFRVARLRTQREADAFLRAAVRAEGVV